MRKKAKFLRTLNKSRNMTHQKGREKTNFKNIVTDLTRRNCRRKNEYQQPSFYTENRRIRRQSNIVKVI